MGRKVLDYSRGIAVVLGKYVKYILFKLLPDKV